MNLSSLKSSPVAVRVVPFAVFLALTFAQDRFGEAGRCWIYLLKTVVSAGMLWSVRDAIPELRWKLSSGAVLAGVAVWVMWVGLDPLLGQFGWNYPRLSSTAKPWNPHAIFARPALAWFFVLVRLAGSTALVPMLEEVFFRSFLYRYLAQKDFLALPLNRFLPVPFFVTSIVFGVEHNEWLAGVLCGFVYQGLVLWKDRIGDAITAHAVTNFLLGSWVVWKGAWHFW